MFKNFYHFLKFKKRNYPINPFKIVEELLESQFWPRDKIKEYQLQKLNELLDVSKESSLYYNEVLSNITLPLMSLEEYKRVIPTIGKSLAIINSNRLRTKQFTKQFRHATSGSTGDPISTYISGLSEVYRKAGHMRFKDWWGIKEGEKSVLIMRVDSKKYKNPIKRIKKHYRKRYDLDVFDLNENNIKKYCEEIEKFKPSYIRGYKSGVLEFAELIQQKGIKFENFRLKVAIVTSEVLQKEERTIIESILKCPVANEYGSAENGFIAYECPSGNMHIYEEANYLYTNSKNEAIVTDLFNNSMPLINYQNMDIVTISDDYCECGRTSRLIKSLEGRVTNYILKPDGNKLNEFILMVIFYELYTNRKYEDSIKKFKIYQNNLNFLVQIIPSNNYSDACEQYLSKRMREEIGKEINIKFEFVKEIKREKSGKLTYFVRKE